MSASVLEDIAEGSHELLINGHCKKSVYDYLLETRGLTPDTIKKFKIGYCSEEFERTINMDFYDGRSSSPVFKFPLNIRSRVIMPIYDDCGKLVSVATRPIGPGLPWWNTPFTKSAVLFGLNMARDATFSKNKIYVVEGYLDSLTLYQNGLYNVVATMGTRFTLAHIGLISRYCRNVCFCFDSDLPKENHKLGAGQMARQRAMKLSSGYFDDISSILLPLKNDPDDFVKKNGLSKMLLLEES